MGPVERVDYETLKSEWIDQYVMVNPAHSELKRFANVVGRVVTVNYNSKAVIDFQDGGWYDVAASTECLTKLNPAEAKAKFNAGMNSAQVIPEKQV